MTLRGRSGEDQYHAFTARLAAAGTQRTTMRVVAVCILCLAVPAVLAALAPRVAPWPGFRLTYLSIALVTLGMAVPWLRYRWPSRGESATVVLLGTLALAGGCLATIEPMAGLVIASAFSIVLGFAALFHSTRLLTAVAAVAAATVLWLGVRIATQDVPTALAVVTPIVLVCTLVTFGCRTVAMVGAAPEGPGEIDPLTGLLNSEGFSQRVATLLGARHRANDRYLVLAVIELDNLAAIESLQGGRGLLAVRVAAGQALRETARHDAALAHIDERTFLIADIFAPADPTTLIERVRGAIAATPHGVTASIGAVIVELQPLTDLPPDEVLEDVLAIARGAMHEARAAGGNQARYVREPRLGGSR